LAFLSRCLFLKLERRTCKNTSFSFISTQVDASEYMMINGS
jgi:hypothetical protein